MSVSFRGWDEAAGLPPVPAPTGHAGLVAPDHRARVGMLDYVGIASGRVEGFLAGGADQPRRTDVAGQVLAAERELVQHGQRAFGAKPQRTPSVIGAGSSMCGTRAAGRWTTWRKPPGVFALRPDYRALLLAVDGLGPGPSDQASEGLLHAAEAAARERLA